METDLLKLSEKTFEILSELEQRMFQSFGTVDNIEIDLFKVIKSQFSTLESVSTLLEKGKFKDCLILIRHVFETYFYFLLMLKGRKYVETRKYFIIPKESSSEKDARDRTLDKWVNEWKLGNHKDIINIQPGKDDKTIIVTYEFEGLFEKDDTEKKGSIVPNYFFIFHEYDHKKAFLSSLPTILSGDLYPDITIPQQEYQKYIYHKYLRMDAIIKNLQLNDLITNEHKDRILVHYSFLSSMSHPTREIIKDYDANITREQILLYICRLQFLYLSSILGYIRRTDEYDWRTAYETHIQLLNSSTDYFWFIFNEPTEYDKFESNNFIMWKRSLGQSVNEKTVIYYTDPIERLSKLRMFMKKPS